MDLTYKGANCIKIAIKKDAIVTDGALSKVGLKDCIEKDAVYLATQDDFNPKQTGDGVYIECPGEYEVKDMSVKGIGTQRMIDADGSKQATIYRITVNSVSVVVLGHVHSPLTDEELEAIGVVDIAIVPVGGGGYTLDAHQAVKVIRQLDPRVVIPTHYQDSHIRYEVAQNELAPFITELGMKHERTDVLRLKNSILPDEKTLVELVRSVV